MDTLLATTKLSSKGQVVIPRRIRKSLGLNEGDQFVVLAREGVVILKRIEIDLSTIEKLDSFAADIS